MSDIKKCPKCEGEMEIGYLPGAPGWNYGKSLWAVQKPKRIFGYACKKCGYVEFYVEKEKEKDLRHI